MKFGKKEKKRKVSKGSRYFNWSNCKKNGLQLLNSPPHTHTFFSYGWRKVKAIYVHFRFKRTNQITENWNVHHFWLYFSIFDSFIAMSEIVICLTLYLLGNTFELRNFALTTQREFFICSFESGLFLGLQDSWCLGLLDVWDEMS